MARNQSEEFEYDEKGFAKGINAGGGWKDGKWNNNILSSKTNLSFLYTGGRETGPNVTNWDQYASEKLAAIKPRINASHLLDPAMHHKTPVYFLRGGKQWALVIG